MKELWKDIIGFEGYYQISDLGRVRSLDREIKSHLKGKEYVKKITGRILKPVNNGIGYFQINLLRDGKTLKKYIHVLVAEHFLEKPNNIDFYEVNHIDHIKYNNTVENLEYVTKSENMLKSADFYGRIEYSCVDCKCKIQSYKAKRCVKCSNKNNRKIKNRPNKKELLELLNVNSYVKVGKMFGVSDNTIRNWLK